MLKKVFRIAVSTLAVMIISGVSLSLSAASNNDLVRILQKFKNYRFGEVGVYEIRNVEELKELGKKDDPAAKSGNDNQKCIEDADPQVRILIESGVNNYKGLDEVRQDLFTNGYTKVSNEESECIYNVFVAKRSSNAVQLKTKVFMVTSMPKSIDEKPEKIISLMVVSKPATLTTEDLAKNLGTVQSDQIFTYDDLMDMDVSVLKLQGTTKYNNVYELVYSYFDQGNVTKKTIEARGIGTDLSYFPVEPGTSKPLISGPRIKPEEIQTHMRISQGLPMNIFQKNHELIISPDLIRWTKYKTPYLLNYDGQVEVDDNGNPIVDSLVFANSNLPEFGMEVKYGADEINFVSLWSERMTVSALWESAKFGLIMPTSGWASMGKDVFDQERKLTYAGIGISGEMDFPMAIIKNSGVFSVKFAYLFGDAVQTDYKDMEKNYEEYGTGTVNGYKSYLNNNNFSDYLIRGNGQVHYTFGMAIDNDYLLRFGLGGTFYNVETWSYSLDSIGNDEYKLGFTKAKTKTVGGLSGVLEFMATNKTTPYGGSVQYFNEALRINAWLQVPVVENLFAIRLEAKGYVNAFKNEPEPWENGSVFFPMIRFLFVF